jgi:Asparagine synthase
MSGFYVTLDRTHSIQAAAQRLVCSPQDVVQTITEPGCAIAWVSADPVALFAPAHHAETGVWLVTAGRVAWEETEWQRAEKLNYTGGLSNRLLLDQYLAQGIAGIERHNGAAIVIVYDPRDRQVHLLTDHFGFYPAFLYRSHQTKHCVISSFPEAIAKTPQIQTTPDFISMAEFLCEWKTTPPHTYYQEIKYAGAASHWAWNIADETWHTASQIPQGSRTYWQPFQNEFFPNFNTAVKQLAAAVRHAVKIRTLPRLAPVATYISGGMDSRVIAYAANDSTDMIGFNLYDLPNREATIAQQICQAASIEYVGYTREADYYPKWLRLGVEISGAMWSAENNHFMGTLNTLQQRQVRTVLAAFAVDGLFKGGYLEQKYVQIWGRNLPFFQFVHKRSPGFMLESPARTPPPEFATAMAARLQEWMGEQPITLKTERDRLHVEDRRNRPCCYQPDVSDNMMFRVVPYDIFLGDRAIADCYSKIRPQWKINATVWSHVVAQICGREIVDSNRNWRPGAGNPEKFWVFARDWLQRKLQPARQAQGVATDGSWSDLGWYAAHSNTLREMWEGVEQSDRQLITQLWGSDPWSVPLAEWAKPPTLNQFGQAHGNSPYALFRLLTLINYLSIQRSPSNLAPEQ